MRGAFKKLVRNRDAGGRGNVKKVMVVGLIMRISMTEMD